MFISGIGQIIAFVTLLADGTGAVPPHQQGVANALILTSQQMGVAVGASIILTVFAASATVHGIVPYAFNHAFLTAAAIIMLAITLLLVLIRGHQRKGAPL
jgi:hypothetical protein